MRRAILLLAAVLLLAAAAFAQEPITGRVVRVTDGDTITVQPAQGPPITVRLYGVDCPEGDQPYGDKATDFVRRKVEGQTVTVKPHDKDSYGRTVGEVLTADGQSLDELLVRNGLAWWYYWYAPGQRLLGALEVEARASRLGLWQGQNPVLPWAWRHPQNSQE